MYNNLFVCVVTLISDMKGEDLLNADIQVSPRSEMIENRDHGSSELPNVRDIPELEGDDEELSFYVQDNFDFLDHIDCSVSNQVCVCTAATCYVLFSH